MSSSSYSGVEADRLASHPGGGGDYRGFDDPSPIPSRR
ncbi:hypothetical protein GJR88_00711 [Dietzia sp. DQ12-45-1b]|nr:hypothetical protein GJR88_00711 [Dietzia sp. DQ12-45-1b]